MPTPAPTRVDGRCDARYARHGCLWGVEPDPIAHALARFVDLTGAHVLDAGCGEGRNAAFFAERGARVRAVDVSALALEHARAAWPAHASITWERGDLRTILLPASSLDVVLACSVLHWLPECDDIAATIRRLREATRPGGVHAIVVFNSRIPYEPPAGESHVPWLFSHDWYLEQYRDWIVLEGSDVDHVGAHAGHVEPHAHAMTRLVVRRPSQVSER